MDESLANRSQIVLFDFDCVPIPLDMLKKNELDIVIDKTRLMGSPIVHARTNVILNVIKAICIPYNACSPNFKKNELCGSVAIFKKTCRCFLIWRGVQGAGLMSLNPIANFSLW